VPVSGWIAASHGHPEKKAGMVCAGSAPQLLQKIFPWWRTKCAAVQRRKEIMLFAKNYSHCA